MNYFDHAASTPIYPKVLEVLCTTMKNDFANPSALHLLGYNLAEKIAAYREDFLKILGGNKNDLFVFTSSATESNNTVIRGLSFEEGDAIVYSRADHPSVTAPIENLKNVSLREIILNKDGSIDIDFFKTLIDQRVKLVVLTSVNNQNGVLVDIQLISNIIKSQSNAHVHIDAVQSFGKIHFKMTPQIDSVSITSHKIGGPKGIAGLFLKNGHRVKPLLLGGGQDLGIRSSTQAFPLISGFHEAMKIISFGQEAAIQNANKFSDMIKNHLKKNIPNIIMPFANTSSYIISFVLPGIPSDIILRHLEMRKVYISSTSACSSRLSGFNTTLSAMNISECYHKNFLRISLGPTTTEDQVISLMQEFSLVWDELKHMQRR